MDQTTAGKTTSKEKKEKNKGSSNSQKSVGCAKPRGSVLLP